MSDNNQNIFVQVEKEFLDKQQQYSFDQYSPNNTQSSSLSAEEEIVKFNVGGTLFSTSRSTITKRINNISRLNLLEELITNKVKPTLDENNIIFIDRNPKYFHYILDYLRITDSDYDYHLSTNKQINEYLEHESLFYKLDGLREKLNKSIVLNADQMDELMKLCGFKRNQKFSLLYRATLDGFSANAFHLKCDNHINTLTIIKTVDSYVFGGYTEAAWSSRDSFKADSNAFLFSLINDEKQSRILKCKMPQYAIECNSNLGPTFGRNDLHISNKSNENVFSHSNLGTAYNHPYFDYGTNEARKYLAGKFSFQTVEIEVFKKET